jgi:hypothetical protein
LGRSDAFWFYGAVALIVVQQFIGWFVFRIQLGWGLLSRWFGRADMIVWASVFVPLLIARLLLFILVAIADAGSSPLPRTVSILLSVILLVPALYTIYSVFRYFGLMRAIGGDHFRKEYRNMPLVREGAFRWSGNAMYAFVFFMLWSIALFTGSQAGLALAVFQHAYIWVHYFFTEKPDMNLIYSSSHPELEDKMQVDEG